MPAARISLMVGVSDSSRRAQSISQAAASAGPSALSLPIPREPPVTIATRPVKSNNSVRVGTVAGLYFPPTIVSTVKDSMPHIQQSVGGRFLTRTIDPGDIFTREDLSEEQQLFGRTAAE